MKDIKVVIKLVVSVVMYFGIVIYAAWAVDDSLDSFGRFLLFGTLLWIAMLVLLVSSIAVPLSRAKKPIKLWLVGIPFLALTAVFYLDIITIPEFIDNSFCLAGFMIGIPTIGFACVLSSIFGHIRKNNPFAD